MKREKINFINGQVLYMLFLLMVFTFPMKAETCHYELSFGIDDFNFDLDSGGLKIFPKSMNYTFSDDVESPGLPYIVVNVPLPSKSVYESSSIIQGDKILLYSDVDIASNPVSVPTNDDGGRMNASEAKNYKGKYPEFSLYYSAATFSSTQTVAHFLVCPFEFDSDSKNLELIETVVLCVDYSEDESIEVNSSDYNPELNEGVSSLITIATPMETSSVKAAHNVFYQLNNTNLDYAIITSESLKAGFIDIKNWKMIRGVRTEIFTVEEIYSQSQGDDNQEKIKRFINKLQSQRGVKYVLLGGDESVVPVRYCYCVVNKGIASMEREGSIPSDNYYVCFKGDFKWDGNNNGIYGEPEDNIDFTSDIFISRLPVRTIENVSDYYKKEMKYESGLFDYKKNILMSGVKLFNSELINGNSDAYYKGEKLYEKIASKWNGQRVRFYDSFTDFPDGSSYDVTEENLKMQINQGYAFMDMMTHGSRSQWTMENYPNFNTVSADDVSNSGYSLITTMACTTNAFDQVTPCLSESFIRNPDSGIIAYFGSSREGWGNYDKDVLGPSLTYIADFYENLFDSQIVHKNFAKIIHSAKSKNIASCGWNGAKRWLQFSLNPIGDPEMPIFTERPMSIPRPSITYDNGSLVVDCADEGYDITLISASDYGITLFSALKNTDGLRVNGILNDVILSICKAGYRPFVLRGKTISGEAGDHTILNKSTMSFYDYFTGKAFKVNDDLKAEIVSVSSPGRGKLYVKISVDKNVNNCFVSLFDINGNTVRKKSVDVSSEDTIEFAGLQTGFYVVALTVNDVVVDNGRIAVN